MDIRKRIKLIVFISVFVALLSLACNVPRPLARMIYFENDREEQIKLEHELTDLDATLVSPEGEVVGLKPPHGTDWICADISGEVSEMENTEAFYSDTMKLNKTHLEIELSYDGEENWMSLRYLTEFDRDMAVTGEKGQIEEWYHEVWSNSGSAGRMQLWAGGGFKGPMHIKTTTTATWPQETTSTIDADYQIFGLVDPMDYRKAYLCNAGRNPAPENLDELTPGNFLNSCPFYYYECTAN